ncbi:hypothetical protein BASA50_008503 [Batrachochytrium salamandrivorans]|uniref:SPX domain-containing protein n=1 Tax=Batrachochytrium salamandrivorans TaxID=1357716 RepID=A0ABQ8F416_9FUNG|nr:hypothetical protein BASA50_008503 [Batrachochytrium salamandrivorans]
MGVGLFYSRRRASVSSKEVAFELDGKEGMVMGKKGRKIGKELYALFLLALETSQSYKTLYLDPVNSPFILELPTSTPSGSKQRYKRLQKDVQQSIKNHILDIKYAIRYITREPENVIFELEKLMKKTDNFYLFISSMKPRYSSLLKDLEISGSRHLANLEIHIEAVGAYKHSLFSRFGDLKKIIDDHRANPNRKDPLESLSHPMEST